MRDLLWLAWMLTSRRRRARLLGAVEVSVKVIDKHVAEVGAVLAAPEPGR
jgi:hypothetical protein